MIKKRDRIYLFIVYAVFVLSVIIIGSETMSLVQIVAVCFASLAVGALIRWLLQEVSSD